MNFKFRAATQNDVEFVYKLHRATMHDYVVQTWGQWDDAWQYAYFTEQFDPSTCEIIVSDQNDIGAISVLRRETDIFLKYVQLFPEYQGRGIGTQLILSLSEEARTKMLPLTLQVLKVNPARRLYQRLGFSVTGETKTHYLMTKCRKPGSLVDD